MPITIAFVLFICSLISWKLPFLIRRIMKRNKEMNEIFTMKDCLRVFYEVFITTFYIIFPTYFGLIMRMFKSSNIDGGSYFDYQPSFYYDTKVITESRISYGVVFGLFILLTVALDAYLAIFQLQKTVVTYKVVNWFQKKPISLRSGHPFINIFNKKLYFWVIIVHTRLFIVFCFWSYMQRSSSLQTALLITIYLISTAIQMGFKPFLRETDNYICFLSKFLLLLNSLMTAGELGWNSSNTINSMLIASITLYFMGLLLTTLLPPIIRRFRESDEIGGKDTKTETSVTFNIDNLLNQLSSANEGYKIIKAIIDIPSNPNLSFRQKILLKAMFEEIYDDLMKYAENSHQDFLDVKKFIDDARTLLLRIVTVVLKKQNMIDSLWLNEVGVEWEQMKQKIENKKKSLEEENEESSNQMSSFFDEDF
ncbi:hypothetical protein TRFO_12340 [Tritrichomonas foetus]|uniref:Uncharacterized protein n=1 Tax=Tritrichomonas foetus TaxID=1144522 RepID=A0A1J4J023_9EUKA|nr:hypothetical protein TRFO_12340 [Tritrichomonas foetus]|eukprot:OHS92778.1 hypothetical protein TRFO_12340 [Tritrichomonas foetus]